MMAASMRYTESATQAYAIAIPTIHWGMVYPAILKFISSSLTDLNTGVFRIKTRQADKINA